MCKEALNQKVKKFGVGYGMDIYSDNELLSLVIGIEPEKLTQGLSDIFNNPRAISGIGEKKTLTLLAIKEWMEQEMFFSSDEFNGTIDMALSLLWKMVWTPSIVPKFEAFRLFYRQKFAISKACALLLMWEV